MNSAEEVWRGVVGWESEYEVSSLGRVRSLPRWRAPGQIRDLVRAKRGGYPSVGLSRNGQQSTRTVHVLVAAAFLGERPSGQQVRHLNGDPTDNRLVNLAYGTPQQNATDKREHGRDHNLNKAHCPKGHPYTEENTSRVTPRTSRYCVTCQAERGMTSKAHPAHPDHRPGWVPRRHGNPDLCPAGTHPRNEAWGYLKLKKAGGQQWRCRGCDRERYRMAQTAAGAGTAEAML